MVVRKAKPSKQAAMAGRNRKFKPPYGFTINPKFRKSYEENGVALGKFYLWYPERALKAWSFLAGTLGPRWMLEVYRYHWVQDNPDDYKKWKKSRENARLRKKSRENRGK